MQRRYHLAKLLEERLGKSTGAAAYDVLRSEYAGEEVYVPKTRPPNLEGVRRALESGRKLADVAREFEVCSSTVRRYRSLF